MIFDTKPLEGISEADLQTLLTDPELERLERRRVEYKAQLPSELRDDRKEFLADVTSFANASGGYLIYGIEAHDGIPTSIPGLDIANVDQEKQRLNNIISDGVDPRISPPDIQPVSVNGSKIVLILHIQKSWNLPHMVKGSWRFFSRNSVGKYP